MYERLESVCSVTQLYVKSEGVSFPWVIDGTSLQVNPLMHQFSNHHLLVTPPINKHVDSAIQLQSEGRLRSGPLMNGHLLIK